MQTLHEQPEAKRVLFFSSFFSDAAGLSLSLSLSFSFSPACACLVVSPMERRRGGFGKRLVAPSLPSLSHGGGGGGGGDKRVSLSLCLVRAVMAAERDADSLSLSLYLEMLFPSTYCKSHLKCANTPLSLTPSWLQLYSFQFLLLAKVAHAIFFPLQPPQFMLLLLPPPPPPLPPPLLPPPLPPLPPCHSQQGLIG